MKPSEPQMKVLRMAAAAHPRTVPVKAADTTIFALERANLIVASGFGGGTHTVRIMPAGIAIVDAEKAVGESNPRKRRP